MVIETERLLELGRVIEVTLQVSQKSLSDLKHQEQRTLDQIQGLLERKKLTHAIQGKKESAYHVGVDVLWQQWADIRIEKLNVALARIRAEKPLSILKLRKCFQKKEALREIIESAKAAEKISNIRKSTYES